MKLEERVASAIRAQTDLRQPTTPDLAAIRASAKGQTRRRTAIAVASVVALVVPVFASGLIDAGPHRSDGIDPVDTPSPSPTPTTATKPIDTSAWTTYRSDRYDFEVGHPPNWTEVPASRNWRFDTDAVTDPLSPAYESFLAPSGDVRVSVWDLPLDPAKRIESIAYHEAWVEAYCKTSGNTPCTGIEDRAVKLCLEARDCHPGVLVPFQEDVQAFFSGGIYDADAMTVVAVWRPESDPSVARYGGAQRLLEAFLSTMEVWPASTPFKERH